MVNPPPPGPAPSSARIGAVSFVTLAVLLATAVWTQSRLGDRLLPHAFCISASPPLLALHLVSDVLIAAAYLVIPLAMLRFVRRRPDVPFGWVAWLFGAFIVACGVTHAIEAWTLWYPVYWYAGVAKAFTAAVSLATAAVMMRLLPRALALPSAQQLREANQALQAEIDVRRATERELERAKAQLEALLSQSTSEARRVSAVLDGFFDAAPTGLALVDAEGAFLRVNAALPRMIQAATPGVPGALTPLDLRPEMQEVPGAVVDAMARVRAGDGPHSEEVAVTRPASDGQLLHWHFAVFAIPTESGTALCGCIMQDVTRERTLERQRAEALSAAEEANRAKDEFLARVSHELRTPLQITLSSAEALRRLPETGDLARRFIDRLVHGVSMQARMINDLLDMSRILSGKLDIHNEPVDPAMPLLQVLDHWAQRAQAAGVTLTTEALLADQAIVQADPARLEQIYTNLLDNAIRFSPRGSVVEVGGHTDRGRWQLSVRDHGVGMSPEELEQVFRPFTQGASQPERGKGLGLGLAIVRSLVEAFGGRVWATSAGRGMGTTVWVELPLDPRAAGGPTTPSARAAVRLDGRRVLVVEDQPEVATSMRDGLSALGAVVTVAHRFDEALRLLQTDPPEVLLTDLDLGPGPGGRALAEAARALDGARRVRVVAVSAYGARAAAGPASDGPFDARLIKPLSVEALAQALAALLAEGGPAAPPASIT